MVSTFRRPIRVGDPDGAPGVLLATQSVSMTVPDAAGTADASVVVPAGSIVTAIKTVRSAAAAGSPTTVNFTAGSAAGGAQYVAAADVKAAGVTSHAMIGVGTGTIHFRLATTGGTAVSGTVVVVVEYVPATTDWS